MKKRLAVWGTGKSSRKFESILDETKCEITVYVESTAEKKVYQGIPVMEIDELEKEPFDYLIVASVYDHEIEKKFMFLLFQMRKHCTGSEQRIKSKCWSSLQSRFPHCQRRTNIMLQSMECLIRSVKQMDAIIFFRRRMTVFQD